MFLSHPSSLRSKPAIVNSAVIQKTLSHSPRLLCQQASYEFLIRDTRRKAGGKACFFLLFLSVASSFQIPSTLLELDSLGPFLVPAVREVLPSQRSEHQVCRGHCSPPPELILVTKTLPIYFPDLRVVATSCSYHLWVITLFLFAPAPPV